MGGGRHRRELHHTFPGLLRTDLHARPPGGKRGEAADAEGDHGERAAEEHRRATGSVRRRRLSPVRGELVTAGKEEKEAQGERGEEPRDSEALAFEIGARARGDSLRDECCAARDVVVLRDGTQQVVVQRRVLSLCGREGDGRDRDGGKAGQLREREEDAEAGNQRKEDGGEGGREERSHGARRAPQT